MVYQSDNTRWSVMSNLKTIKLYGDLGKEFGREFHFDVISPAEALRLLAANFKDFSSFFVGDGTKKYHISVGEESLTQEQVGHPVSSAEVIKVVPYVEGSSDNPVLNIVVGAAILYFSGGLGAAFLGETALVGAYAVAANIGWALVIGGVSALLFTPPEPDAVEQDANKPSYNFDGPVNTVRQGNPVPVGYGQLRVGSQVISMGSFSERAAIV